MKKWLMLLSLLPVAVMANPPEHEAKDCAHKDKAGFFKKHHHSADKPFYLKGLDLTDTQKAQVKALMEKRRTDFDADREASRANHQALSKLTMADSYDEAAAEKLIDEQAKAYKQRSLAQAQFHHDVYMLLTNEQQAKLAERMQKFKNKADK